MFKKLFFLIREAIYVYNIEEEIGGKHEENLIIFIIKFIKLEWNDPAYEEAYK